MSTLIGPLGRMVEVRGPQPEFDAPVDRPSSSVLLLSGTVRVQRAPRSSRRWAWLIPAGSPDEIGDLLALEQGVYGPPPWRWYDPVAARVNMLPPAAASPGIDGDVDEVVGASVDGTLTVEGQPHPAVTGESVVAPGRDGDPDPVPVLPGRTYTGSAHIAGAGTITLTWTDADGATISTDADAGVGRLSVTAEAPAGAAGVTVTVADADQVAALQLTEGPLVGWQPGLGIPRVVISGYDLSYRLATASRTLRDIQVDLIEVG